MTPEEEMYREVAKSERSSRRLANLAFWLVAGPFVVGLICCGGYLIWAFVLR